MILLMAYSTWGMCMYYTSEEWWQKAASFMIFLVALIFADKRESRLMNEIRRLQKGKIKNEN